MRLFPILLLASIVTVLADPPSPGLRPESLDSMDAAVRLGMHEGDFPGGVLWFQQGDHVVHRAYGNRQVDPEVHANALDTIYDAASLTKVVATTPAIMVLVERGELDLEKPVVAYLPAFHGNGKEKILVRQLLTHTSGLRPGIPRKPEWDGYEEGLQRIWAEEPLREPDTKFVYSDINFILLGEIVRQVSGKWLDAFCQEHVFGPLQMHDTGFRPDPALLGRIAPTTREGDTVVHGIVHDPTSRRMGGVTGHAGLFITAADVARYAKMILNQGALEGIRILKPETVAMMTRPNQPDGLPARGLGWDIDSPYASLRGEHFGKTSFGHTGWTGTSIWIDPATDAFLLFFSNRNHPSEAGRTREVRIRLANHAAEAIPGDVYQITMPRQVLNGVDVLASRRFRNLRGLNVGLITNHTGVARSGKSTIDLLHASPQVTLKALFGPEHGIRGEMDQAKIADGKDSKTGLPVYSLYDGSRRRPKSEHLEGLDALVFDIQDIGCRFYTYISTMHNTMEEAAKKGLTYVVLDRLNPIDGVTVDGPVREGETSFTAIHPIPVRHGMTVGELAILIAKEKGWDLDLQVIPVSGWRRGLYQDQTDLEWINPSPNMRSLTEAILYPGIGLLEFMKLSVGRGTETPFELVGAPYIDAEKLTAHLNAFEFPGITFATHTFTPTASVFKGEVCQGVKFTLTDRQVYRSVDTGLAIAIYLAKHHAEVANFERFQKLLVHPETFRLVKEGASLEAIKASWKDAREAFAARRASSLLY